MTLATEHPRKTRGAVKGDFPETRWSLILDAQSSDGPSRERALSDLCHAYWYPIFAYIRRKGNSSHDAEDLTQGFFAHLLSGDRIDLLSEDKGGLRIYLLRAVKNFIMGEHAKTNAKKRGGDHRILSLDLEQAEARYQNEPVDTETPERLFEMRWALTMIDRASERLRAAYTAAGKAETFEVLKDYVPKSASKDRQRGIAERLGISESNARVSLFRMRQQFRKHLEEVIGETVEDDAQIEEEVSHLCGLFSKPARLVD